MTLFDRVKRHARHRQEPYLLHDFYSNGLLFHIGLWLYDEYVNLDHRFEVQDCEDLSWYLADLVEFLIEGGVSEKEKWLGRTRKVTNYFESLYDLDLESEANYYKKLGSARDLLHQLHNKITKSNEVAIAKMAPIYAANYADRVFHDRQLCAFISKLIVTIGFDGTHADDDRPRQWVVRKSPPQWVRKSIYSRDRGACAICSKNMSVELEANDHIDHIVPLSQGGFNDLVNLQLLCQTCNLKKQGREKDVTNSVPPYITRRICY